MNAARAVEAVHARLARGLLHGGEIVVVGDGAHQPEREDAGGLGGEMHHQLGKMQHLRRRLGAERGREVLAAGDQRADPLRRGDDLAGVEHGGRILDHRHQPHRLAFAQMLDAVEEP